MCLGSCKISRTQDAKKKRLRFMSGLPTEESNGSQKYHREYLLQVGRVWTGQVVYPEGSWAMAGNCWPAPSHDGGKWVEQLGNYKAFSRTSWTGEIGRKGWALHSCSEDGFSLRNGLAPFLSFVTCSSEALTKGPFTLKGLWTWWSMQDSMSSFFSLLSCSTPTEAHTHSLSCHNCAKV